ncbi:MAG: ATP-binding protein [Planctomycetes bacterium]|nr:ATP-binding protein [Planctomycetota bacterium]
MTVSFDTFDRLKGKGVAAYQNGDYLAAKSYLVDAAECMIELAEAAKTPEARRQHEQIAAELIELVRDCDASAAGGRRGKPAPPGRGGKGGGPRQSAKVEEGETDASDWIVRDKPTIGFDDIAGLDDVKEEIRLKMIYPFAHPELARQYGISTGGGILLYGPPGTGKTMMAKAIAHEIDATFFVVSPAQVMSKWVGEAEQNIRKLFEAAKAETPSVVFLDEIEALVPKRQSDSSTVMQRVVPQILQELEGFDRGGERALLFVGATNKPWMLDEAMLRPGRMDAKVYVPLPDAPARYKLLEIHFTGRPLADDVDLGALCDRLEGFSGADIKNIAQQAAQRPFLEAVAGGEARPIAMKDIVAEIEANPPSVHPSDLTRYEKFAETGK